MAKKEKTWMTPRNAAFIDEYLKSFNKTKAAIAAGYSVDRAAQSGCNVFNLKLVREEIRRRLEANHMTSEEVLAGFADEARGDIGEFLEQSDSGEIKVVLFNKDGTRKNTKLIQRVTQTKTIRRFKDGSEEEELRLSLDLYSAQYARSQLGRAHALFTDKIDTNAGGPLPIIVMKKKDLQKLLP